MVLNNSVLCIVENTGTAVLCRMVEFSIEMSVCNFLIEDWIIFYISSRVQVLFEFIGKLGKSIL